MSTLPKIYFAHPVNTYGTPLEIAIIDLITKELHCTVENPNQPHHQKGYEEWKARTAKNRDTHNAMAYFYEEVLPKLDGCVALPFLDGRLGLGVAGETKKFIERVQTVWFLEPVRILTLEELEEFVRSPSNGFFRVRPFTPREITLIQKEVPEKISELVQDARLVLQHQETRLRTFRVYNHEKRPYGLAHLVSMPIPPGFYPEDSRQ